VASSALDPLLTSRLVAVGLDPADFGEPALAWRRLHERFGRRVTLIDRYALEAAVRGVRPEQLDRDERGRLAREVLAAQYPGLEFMPSAGRQAPDAVEVVPYRDEWAASFAAWRKRLQRALGDAAGRIEHVGSTAVPELCAKPIIDIQVSVRDVEVEASYVPAIESLGLSLRLREPEHRYFRSAGDRPRTVQIHVCEVGGEWECDHLLFRDYLRADRETRAAYERLKRDLSERYRDDRLAYNEGKTGFILDSLEAARAWAERTGWKVPPVADDEATSPRPRAG
jgi:GrpB-like predicted nucleotidyltransferase (UPF0157 family)